MPTSVWVQDKAELIWVPFGPRLCGPDLHPIPHLRLSLFATSVSFFSFHRMNLWVLLEFFPDSVQVDLLFQKKSLRSISGIDFCFLGGNKKEGRGRVPQEEPCLGFQYSGLVSYGVKK